MHKRLSVQSLIIAYGRPMFAICQHLYTLCVEVDLQELGILLGGLSDCEELVGGYLEGV